jgi:hypothetical protein
MPADPALDAPTARERLEALRELAARRRARGEKPPATREANNHVHTIYSFSPYSPAAAAERAHAAGLLAVGIMDHDSIAGAEEMGEAGRILGIATTAGLELRVSAVGTPLADRKINNPDSNGNLYMAIHGVPRRSLVAVRSFLLPIQAAREARDRIMVEKLNAVLGRHGIAPLDFRRDVYDASRASEGGSITERHILFAAARNLVQRAGKGAALVSFLRSSLGVAAPPRIEEFLRDEANEFLLYDLLGLLKSSFIGEVFVQPGEDECIPVLEAVRFAEDVGAIPCYAYLGDVTDSPTGDKKAERFEDAHLDELIGTVKELGFRAVTYMPPRNTPAQLRRIQALCSAHGFMEISGVDINTPRQSFRCPELLQSEFSHLIDATFALIAHENLADADPRFGIFHPEGPLAKMPLPDRIEKYAAIGRTLDLAGERPAIEHPTVVAWRR